VSARVHHSAIVVRDIDTSLRFWRDGIGFAVTMDTEFDGDWPALFGASASRLRSVFLGDAERPDSGIVELVQFVAGARAGDNGAGGDDTPAAEPRPTPAGAGFFLLSCYVDVDAVLERLRSLGLGGEPRRIAVPGPRSGATVEMATVVDPDGVLVELIGRPAS
jgi:catechol 2,3-dioxygenase-like lactoylglutathione lyase family enzyme